METHSEILYVARVRVRVREPHPALAQPIFQSILGNAVRKDKRKEKEIVYDYMTNSNYFKIHSIRKRDILKRLLNTLCLAILDLGTIGFSFFSVDVGSTQGLLYVNDNENFLRLYLVMFKFCMIKRIFPSLISQDQTKAG